MNSNEDILNLFLSGKLNVARYDYYFFHNINEKISENSPITSNQAKLFTKLVHKYRKEFGRAKIDSSNFHTLEWNAIVVNSDERHTTPNLVTNGDELILSTPMNKRFISEFNHDLANPFVFNKGKKHYVAKFSTTALKVAYEKVLARFGKINLSEDIQEIINELEKYRAKCYSPTLVEFNGQLFVLAVTPRLAELLKSIKLEKTPKCLDKLVSMGIDIDETVYKDEVKLAFAANRLVTVTNNELPKLYEFVRELDYNGFVITRTSTNLKIGLELKERFIAMGLKEVTGYGKKTKNDKNILVTHNSKTIPSYPGMVKVIVVKDSSTIEVK
jgi:hypothetical protein